MRWRRHGSSSRSTGGRSARDPTGSSPRAPDRVHLEAWRGYHGGLAATRFIDFVPTNPDGSNLADGTVDVFQFSDLGPAFKATAASHDVRVVNLPDVGFFALHVQRAVRAPVRRARAAPALQLCVDLPRDVDAATGGDGERRLRPRAARQLGRRP